MDYTKMKDDELACYVVKLAKEASDAIRDGYRTDGIMIELAQAKAELKARHDALMSELDK